MNIRKKWFFAALLAPALAIGIQGCSSDDDTSLPVVDGSSTAVTDMKAALDALPLGELTTAETDGILYMREEEKLARDAYQYLDSIWDQRVFSNITESEQTHMDSMLLLVERYQLTDPVGDNGPGIFVNTTLQQLYDELIAKGQASLIDALEVGAMIEEVDIVDLEHDKATVEANDDILLVYDNLEKGSRNHLRAFVRNLDNQGITYTPVFLDQAVYDEIINSPMEH